MTWLLIGVLIWVAVAIPVALLIGRGIHLADAKRAAPSSDALDANFAASDEPPVEAAEQPWTGPSTVPFAPSRPPWGGDRTSMPRPRPPVIRAPIRPNERDPGSRDTGPL